MNRPLNRPASEADARDRDARMRRAVLRGDDDAWSRWYTEHAPTLSRAVRRRIRDDAEAEDVLQETWMIAVRRMRQFDPRRAPFSSWLRGIAEHVWNNQRRARDRGRQTLETLSDHPSTERARDAQEDWVDLLASLPPEDRALLRARHVDGCTLEELATREGVTRKAMESRLGRMRAALRQRSSQRSGATMDGDRP